MKQVKIPTEIFRQMTAMREQRNKHAMKIGAAWLEFEKMASGWRMDIQRSQHEEQQLVERYLENELKLDLDSVNVRADYDAGEFLISED